MDIVGENSNTERNGDARNWKNPSPPDSVTGPAFGIAA
jgi:hypothetical protein